MDDPLPLAFYRGGAFFPDLIEVLFRQPVTLIQRAVRAFFGGRRARAARKRRVPFDWPQSFSARVPYENKRGREIGFRELRRSTRQRRDYYWSNYY